MAMSTDGEERLGQLVEGFRLTSVLGKGSTCVVFLGRRVDDTRISVAIKVLIYPAALGAVDRVSFRQRFLREARAANKLTHPHVLQVTGFGETDDLTYMIMPLVTGGTLATSLERAEAPLPLARVQGYLDQLAGALDYAHAHGIVHRDVKPSNVLLDERAADEQEWLYLTDFGIARLFDEGVPGLTTDRMAVLTRTGQVLGTPYYMAPEQITGGTVGPAADIYALGVMLYQMTTGQLPFRGDSVLAVALQHVQDDPAPPSLLRPDLPPQAEMAIMRALAKRPGDRFASAGGLAQAFALSLSGDKALRASPDDSNETRPASSPQGLAATVWADSAPLRADGHPAATPLSAVQAGAPPATLTPPGHHAAGAPATTSAAPPVGSDWRRQVGALAGLPRVRRAPLAAVSALVLLSLVGGLAFALAHWPGRATGSQGGAGSAKSTSTSAGTPPNFQMRTYETHRDIGYTSGADAPTVSVSCGAADEQLVSGGYRIDESDSPANPHPNGAVASYPSDARTWSASVHNTVPGSTVTLYVTAYCLPASFDAGITIRSASAPIQPWTRASALVACSAGFAVAGGFRLLPAGNSVVVQSRPSSDDAGTATGWIAYAHERSGHGATLDVYVLCATHHVSGARTTSTDLTLASGKDGDAMRGCPGGQALTGGGFEFPLTPSGASDDPAELDEVIYVNHIPGSPGPTQTVWKVSAYNGASAVTGQHTVHLWANCLQF